MMKKRNAKTMAMMGGHGSRDGDGISSACIS